MLNTHSVWMVIVLLLGGCFPYVSQPSMTEFERTSKRAKAGSAVAQNKLGVIYADGTLTPQDHTEATKWYRAAAEQGFAPAQYNLGMAYASGLGVTEDMVEAFAWLSVAAGGVGQTDLQRVEACLSGNGLSLARQKAKDYLEKYGSGT